MGFSSRTERVSRGGVADRLREVLPAPGLVPASGR
jgi:hypothetical protein